MHAQDPAGGLHRDARGQGRTAPRRG